MGGEIPTGQINHRHHYLDFLALGCRAGYNNLQILKTVKTDYSL